MTSPTAVAVPCASISPTVLGETPASSYARSQRELLALDPGCHHAHAAAVARDADPFDHGVDPIAVAEGVRGPLEHDHADALAEERAVGACVERPDLRPLRDSASRWQKTFSVGTGSHTCDPPASARSHDPSSRSRIASWIATRDDAQAASTV